jgi:hypothetical protein
VRAVWLSSEACGVVRGNVVVRVNLYQGRAFGVATVRSPALASEPWESTADEDNDHERKHSHRRQDRANDDVRRIATAGCGR